MVRQANAQYDSEIAEMMDERVRLERDLTRHHAEIRRVAVAGSSDAATTTLIADLHERIAQATARNAELDGLIDDRHKVRLTEDDVRAGFADFDRLWDTLTPREQAKIIALLVARIEFDPTASAISVTFHPTAIQTLMQTKLGGAT